LIALDKASDRRLIMTDRNYCAIYDLSLMPHALGDVLTWNVHSAIRCEQIGRKWVDILICLDEQFPASLHRRQIGTTQKDGLLFNELLGAFGTHPRLGNVQFFLHREEMRRTLHELANDDAVLSDSIQQYERLLVAADGNIAPGGNPSENVNFQGEINGFCERGGRIPLLCSTSGCEPDVLGVLKKRFGGKRIVPIYPHGRESDTGGPETPGRDEDESLMEWDAFLREAWQRHPDVQFVVLGRAPKGQLEFPNLPNVASLRAWGLGLGHELTLMLHSDLYIGVSSGFGAMARFSKIPYAITRMTQHACRTYGIEIGVERLAFGTDRQFLYYGSETKSTLMHFLERGLADIPIRDSGSSLAVYPPIDVRSWEWERSRWLHPGATTYRFYDDAAFVEKETAFLLWPHVLQAQAEMRRGHNDKASKILERIESHFPRVCGRFREFLELRMALAAALNDVRLVEHCKSNLLRLSTEDRGNEGISASMTRLLAKEFPAVLRLGDFWKRKYRIPGRVVSLFRLLWRRKHRIPHKLAEFLKRMASPPSEPR